MLPTRPRPLERSIRSSCTTPALITATRVSRGVTLMRISSAIGLAARVLPGMQSAFVEIGLERAAFLHVADIWENKEPGKPIEKILAEGQPLLVQVVKDPIGSKGARLSTQISIAGRLLVYLPHDPHIGISQKIEDETGRAQLRDRLKELVPPDEKGGFIVRTLAESASEEELRADLDYLRHLW